MCLAIWQRIAEDKRIPCELDVFWAWKIFPRITKDRRVPYESDVFWAWKVISCDYGQYHGKTADSPGCWKKLVCLVGLSCEHQFALLARTFYQKRDWVYVIGICQGESTNGTSRISLQLGNHKLNFWAIDRSALELTAAVNKSQNVCHWSGLPLKVGSVNLGSILHMCVCAVVDLVDEVLIGRLPSSWWVGWISCCMYWFLNHICL